MHRLRRLLHLPRPGDGVFAVGAASRRPQKARTQSVPSLTAPSWYLEVTCIRLFGMHAARTIRTFLVLALAEGIPACSAYTATANAHPLKGLNCDLKGPPPSAGDDGVHGILVKVYPRKKFIDGTYTGCQSSWTRIENVFVLDTGLFFDRGDLRSFWRPREGSSSGTLCEFRAKKLVTEVPECRDIADASEPMASLPPGCVEQGLVAGKLANQCIKDE
jgi:hypothetical protein